jgi:hypothetical protein
MVWEDMRYTQGGLKVVAYKAGKPPGFFGDFVILLWLINTHVIGHHTIRIATL